MSSLYKLGTDRREKTLKRIPPILSDVLNGLLPSNGPGVVDTKSCFGCCENLFTGRWLAMDDISGSYSAFSCHVTIIFCKHTYFLNQVATNQSQKTCFWIALLRNDRQNCKVYTCRLDYNSSDNPICLTSSFSNTEICFSTSAMIRRLRCRTIPLFI
jgi:hypothetical protein